MSETQTYKCPGCGKEVLMDDLYECGQCHRGVCIDCLAVVGSDNRESVCVACPAMEQTRADRIRDGELGVGDAEWLAGQAEDQGEDR